MILDKYLSQFLKSAFFPVGGVKVHELFPQGVTYHRSSVVTRVKGIPLVQPVLYRVPLRFILYEDVRGEVV
jgi:hypothetical protein